MFSGVASILLMLLFLLPFYFLNKLFKKLQISKSTEITIGIFSVILLITFIAYLYINRATI
jgi:lipopolysaccharide export LptBFGC system permease protein LptF